MKTITFLITSILFLFTTSCNNQKELVQGKGEYPHPDQEQKQYLKQQKRSVNPPTEPEKRYPEKREESKESKMSPY